MAALPFLYAADSKLSTYIKYVAVAATQHSSSASAQAFFAAMLLRGKALEFSAVHA